MLYDKDIITMNFRDIYKSFQFVDTSTDKYISPQYTRIIDEYMYRNNTDEIYFNNDKNGRFSSYNGIRIKKKLLEDDHIYIVHVMRFCSKDELYFVNFMMDVLSTISKDAIYSFSAPVITLRNQLTDTVLYTISKDTVNLIDVSNYLCELFKTPDYSSMPIIICKPPKNFNNLLAYRLASCLRSNYNQYATIWHKQIFSDKNFNPRILQKSCNKDIPHICIFDNVYNDYKTALKGTNDDLDGKAKDKATLCESIDSFDSTIGMIALYSCSKTYTELENERKDCDSKNVGMSIGSFYRAGRVKIIITFNENKINIACKKDIYSDAINKSFEFNPKDIDCIQEYKRHEEKCTIVDIKRKYIDISPKRSFRCSRGEKNKEDINKSNIFNIITSAAYKSIYPQTDTIKKPETIDFSKISTKEFDVYNRNYLQE